MSKLQILIKGLIRENPTFVLLLGMCPTLGTTTSALNGMGMGAATLFVLTLSNITLSLTLLGAVRELLGAGAIFGHKLIAGDGMLVFILAPGAFIALAYLMTIFNKLTAKHKQG